MRQGAWLRESERQCNAPKIDLYYSSSRVSFALTFSLDLRSCDAMSQTSTCIYLCPSSATSTHDKSMLICFINTRWSMGKQSPLMPKSASISTSKKIDTDTRH